MNITIESALLLQFAGIIATATAFYALTNYRLKKLEEANEYNRDIRERLTRIETILTELQKKAQ